ncbi:MAG: hypothetical protein AB4352_10875 [Hormoscilla sp.]
MSCEFCLLSTYEIARAIEIYVCGLLVIYFLGVALARKAKTIIPSTFFVGDRAIGVFSDAINLV